MSRLSSQRPVVARLRAGGRTPLPSAGPACGALAEERVHAFLAILSEEVASDRVPGDAVGLAERHLELAVEHLLAAMRWRPTTWRR